LPCTDSSGADKQENPRFSKESRFLPGEMSTQSTKANSEETIVPSGSVGSFFGDLGPDRTQTVSGEGRKRSDVHKVLDVSSHVPTLAVATELFNNSQLEGCKTASQITKDTLAIKGKFLICSE